MDTKAKPSHTADNVFGLGWESTPVIRKEKKRLRRPGLAACIKESDDKFFAVCVSWVVTRKLSPICEMADLRSTTSWLKSKGSAERIFC
eukprot:673619-Pelagomonas_calceolata.AAC.1